MLLGSPVGAEENAFHLRDLGLAQLENDQPGQAEQTFEQLANVRPADALPWADLGIARLRQQKVKAALQAIDQGLRVAPDRADLMALRGLALEWQGSRQEALQTTRRAASRAPNDVGIQYQLLRQTEGIAGDDAANSRREALHNLSRLRPENLFVLLRRAGEALDAGAPADATAAVLRVRELIWQAPAIADTLLKRILSALEAGDLAAAKIPLAQLSNVLKTTPMYREGVKELDAGGKLGQPVRRFVDEPPPSSFGAGLNVTFSASRITDQPVGEKDLAVGDFDGDGNEDVAILQAAGKLQVLWGGEKAPHGISVPAIPGARITAVDLDDDGRSELIVYGPSTHVLTWNADRSVRELTGMVSLPSGLRALVGLDYDIEGDLDLAGGDLSGPVLLRNALHGRMENVSRHAFPQPGPSDVVDLLATDLDRDGDLDLLLVTPQALWVLDNQRQGRFVARKVAASLGSLTDMRCAVSADFDNDGWPDLAVAGQGFELLHNVHGKLVPWPLPQNFRTSARFDALTAFDADFDGRVDLALAGPVSSLVLLQRPGMHFQFAAIQSLSSDVHSLLSADLDGDGDLDLIAGGEGGLFGITNQGGNQNHWLAVRLHGLTDGSSKNNAQGIGSVLEVHAGRAYQFQEVQRPVSRFGLGSMPTAPVLRVVWTNGVPQNRLEVGANQLVVEEQVLKGSCPFLYTWNGSSIEFVTDLLWNTMLGMPFGNDHWAPPVPTDEIVRVDGAQPRDGAWDLRVTGELWEAFFFDRMRLWVVDHPDDVEVASNLRVLAPGTQIPPRVLGTRSIHPLARAVSGDGKDLTSLLSERDNHYAHAFEPSRYQGVAKKPWSIVLDLGEAPATSVRLLLEGWLFPPDASLNVAVSQRTDLAGVLPRLDVETPKGWQPLMRDMGLPAGKIKEMVVDTPPLPAGARRLRIVSSWWIAFDRIRWSTSPADEDLRMTARLAPSVADFHYRGFSKLVRQTPWGSHTFDYAQVSKTSPWLPFPGRYTRYGDVRELLQANDDRSVIVGPGDEIALRFPSDHLPALPAGWTRTVFLESDGWGKDADRNTLLSQHTGPLPWRGMTEYPPRSAPPGDDTAWREWQNEWLTRVVQPETPGPN